LLFLYRQFIKVSGEPIYQKVISIEKIDTSKYQKDPQTFKNSKKSRTGVCLRTNWKSCFFNDIKHKNRRERKNYTGNNFLLDKYPRRVYNKDTPIGYMEVEYGKERWLLLQ
jgi:hypothetical protein